MAMSLQRARELLEKAPVETDSLLEARKLVAAEDAQIARERLSKEKPQAEVRKKPEAKKSDPDPMQ
jgi:hypothetical protein